IHLACRFSTFRGSLFMNGELALARDMPPISLGELLTVVGLPSKRSTRQLSGATEELFKNITNIVDEMLLRVIEKRTKAEFVATRREVFGDYARAVRALSDLARIVVPERTLDRLLGESFCELEDDLRNEGLLRFGAAAKDQAVFTVWTLRKMSGLIAKIANSGDVPEHLREQDRKLASDFSFYAIATQFHLDCMGAAIRFNKPLHPEVLPNVIDGLRSAVNAYGLIRQGVNLRIPRPEEPTITPYVWDEEDQELLDSSMHAIESEAS
ncbi:MAG: hypothetical protein ACRD9L_20510, partial [Bryobacteraceae bacterium]